MLDNTGILLLFVLLEVLISVAYAGDADGDRGALDAAAMASAFPSKNWRKLW